METGENDFRIDFSFDLPSRINDTAVVYRYDVMIVEPSLFRYRTNKFKEGDTSLLKIEDDELFFKHKDSAVFQKDLDSNSHHVIDILRYHYYLMVEKPLLDEQEDGKQEET